ncbi:hypothetical protein [Corynebacterium comes]|nr:hypothetical protein [Corynebacterium comes]
MGFGAQWRDLLSGAHDAMKDRGFSSSKLPPAGYKLPVVNDCLVYLWRVSDSSDPSSFASSQTKKNGFGVRPPDPMLFETIDDIPEEGELERVVQAAGGTMPLVLVMVHSSHLQLQSIEWAVAELIEETGKVNLHGRQTIWRPEPVVETMTSDVESFDSGAPVMPAIAPREQEGLDPDA